MRSWATFEDLQNIFAILKFHTYYKQCKLHIKILQSASLDIQYNYSCLESSSCCISMPFFYLIITKQNIVDSDGSLSTGTQGSEGVLRLGLQ